MSMCSVACGQRGQSLRCAVISRYVANTVAKAVPSYFRRFVYLNCNVVGPCYFILRERRIGHTTTPLHSVHVRADVHLFQIFALDFGHDVLLLLALSTCSAGPSADTYVMLCIRVLFVEVYYRKFQFINFSLYINYRNWFYRQQIDYAGCAA